MCCKEGMCKGVCKGSGCGPAMVGKVLLAIGGLNWGLIGLGMLLGNMGNWNAVNVLFGAMPEFEGIVYVLVGVSALMVLFGCKCEKCKDGVCGPCAPAGEDANKTAGNI